LGERRKKKRGGEETCKTSILIRKKFKAEKKRGRNYSVYYISYVRRFSHVK